MIFRFMLLFILTQTIVLFYLLVRLLLLELDRGTIITIAVRIIYSLRNCKRSVHSTSRGRMVFCLVILWLTIFTFNSFRIFAIISKLVMQSCLWSSPLILLYSSTAAVRSLNSRKFVIIEVLLLLLCLLQFVFLDEFLSRIRS